jgi:hypothetical protein
MWFASWTHHVWVMGNIGSSLSITVDPSTLLILSITPNDMTRVLSGCERAVENSAQRWSGALELSFEFEYIRPFGRWTILNHDQTQVIYSSVIHDHDAGSKCIVSLPNGEYTLITGPALPSQSPAHWSFCSQTDTFASIHSFSFAILDGECYPHDPRHQESPSPDKHGYLSRRLQTGYSHP